jgi:hypothetical protein
MTVYLISPARGDLLHPSAFEKNENPAFVKSAPVFVACHLRASVSQAFQRIQLKATFASRNQSAGGVGIIARIVLLP